MEVNVFKAKSTLSALLRKVEAGETVFIRRGRKGPRFRLMADPDGSERTLEPDPSWAKKIAYEDESIWESEWRDE